MERYTCSARRVARIVALPRTRVTLSTARPFTTCRRHQEQLSTVREDEYSPATDATARNHREQTKAPRYGQSPGAEPPVTVETRQKLRAALATSSAQSTALQADHKRPHNKLVTAPDHPHHEPRSRSKNWTGKPTQAKAKSNFRKVSGNHVSAISDSSALSTQSNEDSLQHLVKVELDGATHEISAILLRDSCRCPRCVDSSTKQKLFLTTDIPASISGTSSSNGEDLVDLRWTNDVPGIPEDHVTTLPKSTLRGLVNAGSMMVSAPKQADRILWTSDRFQKDVLDVDYETYMSDDGTLHGVLQHLHTHGLVFLTNVPGDESSVSTIAERIGPLKNTFYGATWDVRSVPQAKNVAYTSQNLGYHMDLLYMKQPPHLQFLHCIRSSSAGGASLFTDSLRAASDLFLSDPQAFNWLTRYPINFHYDHPESQYYHQQRSVIELHNPLFIGGKRHSGLDQVLSAGRREASKLPPDYDITKLIDAVSWSPPFQGPFSLRSASDSSGIPSAHNDQRRHPPTMSLNFDLRRWHDAAGKFNQLIHRPEMTYERMMKPGECVLFDNRRVLHARKAFEVGDMGKERWLRGAYVDRDPYQSKMRLLQERFMGA